MIHQLTIRRDTDRRQWRQELMRLLKTGDQVTLEVPAGCGFTQQRQLITSLNTVCWARGCQLRYTTEDSWQNPPLPINYGQEPNITPPRERSVIR